MKVLMTPLVIMGVVKVGGGQGQPFDDHDWKGAKALSKQEKNELGHEVAEALRQGSMAAGKMAGSGAEVGFDKMLEPQVDWREVLREFVTATCTGNDFSTYARPNRTLHVYRSVHAERG